jgi:hypothetical protein
MMMTAMKEDLGTYLEHPVQDHLQHVLSKILRLQDLGGKQLGMLSLSSPPSIPFVMRKRKILQHKPLHKLNQHQQLFLSRWTLYLFLL